VFAPVVLIAWVFTSIVVQLGGVRSLNDACLIYAGVTLLGTTLPAAVWMWSEPDPTEPEELPA